MYPVQMQTRSQSKLSQSKLTITKSGTTKVASPSSPVTRSQTNQTIPVFDFDESSAAWLKNKTKLGNGTYSYKVSPSGITTRSGKVLTA